MDISTDTTQEELKVFLQEAGEQLGQLDEDILKLEREGGSKALLQDIFRVAHTLKGSSAMLGCTPMTHVAHAMESVLDRLRKDTLPVSAGLVNVLLQGVDALNTIKDDLASARDSEVDITDVVARLESMASGEAAPEGDVPASGGGDANPGTGGAALICSVVMDSLARNKIAELGAMGQVPYVVKVSFAETTLWASVRCFQTMEELRPLAEIITSVPSLEQIEAESAGPELELLVCSFREAVELREAIASIQEVVSADVAVWEEGVEVGQATEVQPEASKPVQELAVSQLSAQQGQTIRIDVERLDHMMNSIGELVIDRTRMLKIGKSLETKYGEDALVFDLGQTSAHIAKVVDEIEEDIMKMRMLPVETVFSGFPRMMRDLSQRAGKKVNFIIEGGDTELDRTVIEHIRDPLVHLLRNAVDHGIELPEERVAAGKPAESTIRLSANHEQGHIVINVEDDGRGIDPVRLLESAIRKGFITQEIASKMTEAEALDLIFVPGSSTAEKATEVSGRGVGMDIVKTRIEAINGFVGLETRVGTGTRFNLVLPLTLATLQALLVSSAQTLYAIPVMYVVEVVALDAIGVEYIAGKEVIRLRDKVVPLLRLSEAFHTGGSATTVGNHPVVVVVRLGERLVGLVVDSLTELQEVMVKSLGNLFGGIRGIAGVSVLADGQVVLILDVPALVSTHLAAGAGSVGDPWQRQTA